MAERDNPEYREPVILRFFEVIPAEEIPEPGEDGTIPEDEAWSQYRAEVAEDAPPPTLMLEAGSMVVLMTLADLGAEDLEGAYAELSTGSYQQAVYNQGAGFIVLLGAVETEQMLWANLRLGETALLHGVGFIGLSANVREAREADAAAGQIILTSGPLVTMVLDPGEVAIGAELSVAQA